MAKTTITMPQELIDKAKELGINVSGLSRRELEKEIKRIEKEKKA